MITVGRLSLPDPKAPSDNGQSLSFTGLIHTLSQADTNARRLQITGMKGQLVPVVWTPGEINGFYRVADASCDVHYVTAGRSAMRYSLSLEFVAHAPDFESLLIGAQVLNDHAVTGKPWHATPVGSEVYMLPSGTTATEVMNTTEGGSAIRRLLSGSVLTVRWRSTPAAWYLAGVRVEVGGHVVTGLDAPNTPASWTLSNGLVRVTAAASGRINVDVYTGGAWRSKTFDVYANVATGFVLTSWKAVTVTDNDPAYGSVLLVGDTGTGGRILCDISLRRGATFATVTLRRTSLLARLGIGRNTAEAATAITAGLRATASDVNGNRYLIASPTSVSTDLTTGILSTPAVVSKATFFVGYEIAGSTAVAGNTAAEVVQQAMWHTDERVRPVKG